MALIVPIKGIYPVLGNDCWMAENATLIGEVTAGEQCTFWFNAVVRADVNYIRMGNRVNVQDGAVIHATFEKFPTVIGNDVSIGHRAIVHGCTLEDRVLVGMGSIVMDGVYVESNSIIAAGAVVLEGTRITSGSIYAGIPAKKVKSVEEAQTKSLIERIATNYVKYAGWFK